MFLLPPPEALTTPPLEYPHPVITEVLYAVPTKAGDANRDGKRSTSGDEFVELINPHDRTINLKGYSLRDSGEGKARFKFTFPSVELQPGEVVVVFNGNESTIKGPVGDAKSPPSEGNSLFHGALIFSAKITSSRASWANKSDYVLLSAPNGSPLECVYWGDEHKPPANTQVTEEAPAVSRGSIQRARITDDLPPEAAGGEGNDTGPATQSAGAPSNAKSKPDPAAKSPARGTDPAKPAPKSTRPVYQRKPEKKAESPPTPRPKLTFADFQSHPAMPQALLGRAPDAAEEGAGILFSPGLYPFDAAFKAAEPEDAAEPAADAPPPAKETKPSPSAPRTPTRNTGDPR